jgi:hypothetical protein
MRNLSQYLTRFWRSARGTADTKLDQKLQPSFHRSQINDQILAKIHKKYAHVDPYPGFSKYLDAEHYIATALHHYSVAELNPFTRNSILDLGSGAGYFPFVCQNIGHEAMCLDVSDNPFYGEMIDLLTLNRIEHRIEPFQLLPSLPHRFDVVTAFAICFNGHDTDALWGSNEWSFFLSDLQKNVLTEGGRVCLVLNREKSGETITSSLRKLFESMGAEIRDLLVKIPAQQ